nr:MAG TPA: hypothetical protein [Caudoviricetes sp.]
MGCFVRLLFCSFNSFLFLQCSVLGFERLM